MQEYRDIFVTGYTRYARYLWSEITTPHWGNYFYWLIGVSLFFFVVELVRPWKKRERVLRQDFWLDVFYMFFNFFLFSLVIYNAASNVVVQFFLDALAAIGITNLVAIEVSAWPLWAQLVTLFIVRDFIQWNVHRLLHRVPWLWEFHKVHHSVREMGFAAHLRYHWMENVVYNALQYLPLAMIGFGIDDFFIVYIVSLAIGHFNHSNILVPLGPLKYVLNNPQMHIWHHAKTLPGDAGRHRHGINFGLSLSLWDYLFGTAEIPESGRDIELGFDGVEEFPTDFVHQNLYGLGRGQDGRSRSGRAHDSPSAS